MILAGVAISLTIGQNGIFARAEQAVNVYEKATANEQSELDKVTGIIDGYLPSDKLTIGSVYQDSMIGQSINYSANGQNDWIILGKDSSGNVLITTPGPVTAATYTVREDGVEAWLFYEDDINTACSVYGGTVQNQAVTARGITMEDINYAVGFVNPGPEFEEYTFGNEYNWEENKVNYWYPSKDAENYRVNPNEANEDGTYPSETFANDAYVYGYTEENGYVYEGVNGSGLLDDSHLTRKENMKYIIGDVENGEALDPYVVASRSVEVDSDIAAFYIAGVYEGYVDAGNGHLCNSDADGLYDIDVSGSLPVRPVVVLPSGLEVEEQSDGTYRLK